MNRFLLLLAGASWLVSCNTLKDAVNPDNAPLADSAKAWLHEQHGQLLTFRNAAGATQLVRVGRRLETATGHVVWFSPATREAEVATLAYSLFPVKRDSFGVVACLDRMEFRYQVNAAGDLSPGTNNMASDLLTHDDPKRERSLRDSTDLRSALVLGGRTYTRLMVVDRLASYKYLRDPGAFEEVYYTRGEGLVGFTDLGGELWLRQ